MAQVGAFDVSPHLGHPRAAKRRDHHREAVLVRELGGSVGLEKPHADGCRHRLDSAPVREVEEAVVGADASRDAGEPCEGRVASVGSDQEPGADPQPPVLAVLDLDRRRCAARHLRDRPAGEELDSRGVHGQVAQDRVKRPAGDPPAVVRPVGERQPPAVRGPELGTGSQRAALLEQRRQAEPVDGRRRRRQDGVRAGHLVGRRVAALLDQRDPRAGLREEAGRRAARHARTHDRDIEVAPPGHDDLPAFGPCCASVMERSGSYGTPRPRHHVRRASHQLSPPRGD